MKQFFIFLFASLYCFAYSQNGSPTIDSIENIIKTSKDRERILSEKSILVVKYFLAGNDEKSNALTEEIEKELSIKNSDFGLGALLHAKGTIYYYNSQYDTALVFFSRAYEIRRKITDEIGVLKSLSNIAGIHYMLGNYKTALEFCEKVQKMESEQGIEEGTYLSINNLGAIYKSLGMPRKSISYFKKAEKKYAQQNSPQILYSYDGLCDAYKAVKKYDSALFYAIKVQEASIKYQDQRSYSYAALSVGTSYVWLKQNDSALVWLYQTLNLARELSDMRLQMAVYGNLAGIYTETGQMDSASLYIEKLMAAESTSNINVNSEDIAKLYSVYYYNKNDLKNAYYHLQRYTDLKDSLYNISANGQLIEMQEKYETEKKEKENQILQSENKVYKTTRNYLIVILLLSFAGIAGAVVAYKKIKNTNKQLHDQKLLVEEKQKEILDSINYAKRIQFALLASDSLLEKNLPEHFVLFQPKDVVSGDFYWGSETDDGFLYITADCTGHGVPGAFMSLLNISKLNQIVSEKNITRPDLVLNELRKEIIEVLNPVGSQTESKDGMDAILCKLNIKKMRLEYAAANNSFYIIRNKSILNCKADKMPVGKGHDDSVSFTYNEIKLEKNDIIYTLTDGYADQFGGPHGKKFKYKALEELLLSVHALPLSTQKEILSKNFSEWKGALEQIDDVCLIGVKI